MECLYTPNLDAFTISISLSQEEARHARALRLELGEYVLLTSGKGIMAKAELIDLDSYTLRITQIRENIHELPIRFGIALSVLSSKDRMEFAIEKLTELGITDFYFIDTIHCQNHSIDEDRFRNKAIAAMKQSKRSYLPTIHALSSINSLGIIAKEYSAIILADLHGKNRFPDQLNVLNLPKGALLCIGPEGGYSEEEIKMIKDFSGSFLLSLANRRLRAETAAIALAAICQFHWLE